MPTSRGGHRTPAALPPARDVAAWERLHPGTAAALLAEHQRDRRHARAMDWARLALQGVTVLGGLGAVTTLAWLGHPLVGLDGPVQGPGLLLGVGSVIGLLVGRRPPIRCDPRGNWQTRGRRGGADQPEPPGALPSHESYADRKRA
jgi:hypothetical protein